MVEARHEDDGALPPRQHGDGCAAPRVGSRAECGGPRRRSRTPGSLAVAIAIALGSVACAPAAPTTPRARASDGAGSEAASASGELRVIYDVQRMAIDTDEPRWIGVPIACHDGHEWLAPAWCLDRVPVGAEVRLNGEVGAIGHLGARQPPRGWPWWGVEGVEIEVGEEGPDFLWTAYFSVGASGDEGLLDPTATVEDPAPVRACPDASVIAPIVERLRPMAPTLADELARQRCEVRPWFAVPGDPRGVGEIWSMDTGTAGLLVAHRSGALVLIAVASSLSVPPGAETNALFGPPELRWAELFDRPEGHPFYDLDRDGDVEMFLHSGREGGSLTAYVEFDQEGLHRVGASLVLGPSEDPMFTSECWMCDEPEE